ncbi:MAG: prepilin-type N-terminal cleavage/methylation domain-containing protein, partial [Kiritimatiellia bacterium]|nr:prepilin-type N-terminal cleavage/methylation domain-containing protein [Kiritimatiellia bacterium]
MKKISHSAIGRSAFCLRSKSFRRRQGGYGGQFGGQAGGETFYIPWPSSGRLHSSFCISGGGRPAAAGFTLIELLVATALIVIAL